MREMLFRGKSKATGEWYYGNLNVNVKCICIITPDDTPIGKYGQVIPETVGQYTGLTDKNGTKIFEGDIVDVLYDVQYVGVAAERIGKFEVVFCNGCFMKKKIDGNGLVHFIGSDVCEIIGNIHDNPELLKGGE